MHIKHSERCITHVHNSNSDRKSVACDPASSYNNSMNPFTVTEDIKPLINKTRQFVSAHSLWDNNDHLLLAVSGGADSMMMMHLLCFIFAPEQQLRLTVAHVNHNLRPEAQQDEDFVAKMADSLGLKFISTQVDVSGRVATTGESIEEAARNLRYSALQHAAESVHATAIVTAHTADDQAETVLMRILRGTGTTGLAGIPARRNNIVRPLLSCSRNEVIRYLSAMSFTYRIDSSNASTEFTRNKVRLELLPMLEANYSPELRAHLRQLAELASDDEEFLQQISTEQYQFIAHHLDEGIALPHRISTSRALLRRLWRLAIAEVRGGLQDIDYSHITAIEELPLHQQLHLPGVHVLHEKDQLLFLPAKMQQAAEYLLEQKKILIPGSHYLPEAKATLHIDQTTDRPAIAAGNRAILDAEAVIGDLQLRYWQAGDRYQPYGAPGTRKLQDIFVDSHLTKRLRKSIPLIIDNEGILWVAGYRPAQRVTITETSKSFLTLTIEWETDPWI